MPNFPYSRAALVLAEASCFGKQLACSKYHVANSTYNDWKQRLGKDDKLAELYQETLSKLREEWQEDSIKALKKGLEIIYCGFENHPFEGKPVGDRQIEAWGRNIDALSKAIKSIGDLAISTHILKEDDED